MLPPLHMDSSCAMAAYRQDSQSKYNVHDANVTALKLNRKPYGPYDTIQKLAFSSYLLRRPPERKSKFRDGLQFAHDRISFINNYRYTIVDSRRRVSLT